MKLFVLSGIILFAMILYNCRGNQDTKSSNPENNLSINHSNKQIPKTDTINFTEYKVSISKSLPDYLIIFYTHTDSYYTFYDSIIVKNSDKKILQSINIYDEINNETIRNVKNQQLSTFFWDFNFDGYKDIILERELGGTGNCWNNIWLYKNNLHKFIYNYQLSELCLPTLDSVNWQIKTLQNFGDDNYLYGYYKWLNNNLILIKEIEYIYSNADPYQRRVERRRINGKMKIVSNKRVTDNSDNP